MSYGHGVSLRGDAPRSKVSGLDPRVDPPRDEDGVFVELPLVRAQELHDKERRLAAIEDALGPFLEKLERVL